jgi:hypothetical protein
MLSPGMWQVAACMLPLWCSRQGDSLAEQMASCACSLSISIGFSLLGFSGRTYSTTRAQRRHEAAEEGSMENGWAELPEELLTKVLVQAVEQCTPQDGG